MGAKIYDGDAFSGLSGNKKDKAYKITSEKCDEYYDTYQQAMNNTANRTSVSPYVDRLIRLIDKNDGRTYKQEITTARAAMRDYTEVASRLDADDYRFDAKYEEWNTTCTTEEADRECVNARERSIISTPYCAEHYTSYESALNAKLDTSIEKYKKDIAQRCVDEANRQCDSAREMCLNVNAKRISGNTAAGYRQADEQALPGLRTKLDSAVDALKNACDTIAESDNNDAKGLSKGAAVGIGAAVGAVAGGVLGYTITDSIQKAALDQAEQAAIKEFMENVGSKIQCYIGGDEVGSYGDVISTSME